jgi:hypothetical protein
VVFMFSVFFNVIVFFSDFSMFFIACSLF